MDLRNKHERSSFFFLLSHFLKIFLAAFLLLSLYFLFNHLQSARYFPIKTVRIYGANQLNQAEVKHLLLPLVSKSFFTLQLNSIRERLARFPWISGSSVRRVWPDKLEIMVYEKKPVAIWNNSILLSETGDLFMPMNQTFEAGLPQLKGPEGKQIVVLEYFMQINRLLFPLHAKISNLELTPFLTWKLILDNGITLQMGRTDILTRLSHFVKVYQKVVGNRAAEVEYIDLRYPNGLAIRWKAESIKV